MGKADNDYGPVQIVPFVTCDRGTPPYLAFVHVRWRGDVMAAFYGEFDTFDDAAGAAVMGARDAKAELARGVVCPLEDAR